MLGHAGGTKGRLHSARRVPRASADFLLSLSFFDNCRLLLCYHPGCFEIQEYRLLFEVFLSLMPLSLQMSKLCFVYDWGGLICKWRLHS